MLTKYFSFSFLFCNYGYFYAMNDNSKTTHVCGTVLKWCQILYSIRYTEVAVPHTHIIVPYWLCIECYFSPSCVKRLQMARNGLGIWRKQIGHLSVYEHMYIRGKLIASGKLDFSFSEQTKLTFDFLFDPRQTLCQCMQWCRDKNVRFSQRVTSPDGL